LLSFLEQAKNATGDETVVAIGVTYCGHKTIGTCSYKKKKILSSGVFCIFIWEH
jgi:hypothetical protein